MPIFDLKCTQCGVIARDVFLYWKGQIYACRCGGRKFKKLPSSPAIHFKGKGWSKK